MISAGDVKMKNKLLRGGVLKEFCDFAGDSDEVYAGQLFNCAEITPEKFKHVCRCLELYKRPIKIITDIIEPHGWRRAGAAGAQQRWIK